MANTRKRSHPESDATKSAMLLVVNIEKYATEESRIRLLDRIRKSPAGLETIEKAIKILTEEMFNRPEREITAYNIQIQYLESALDRSKLEEETGADLSIYSPTLRRP